MNSSAKSEPAVSPVIGTILLVAIAVVLVAIILGVVMGLTGDTNEKKVGLNAKPATGNDATLILYGGASLDELVKLEMIDQDSPIGEYVKFWDITENESAYVGLPYLAENVAKPLESKDIYDTRINVRGTFSDGTKVILLVQPMTFGNVKGPKIPATPSAVAQYIEKVYFDGVDITDNHGQTTTGFVAVKDARFDQENYGASISGSTFAVQLVNPLPHAVGKIQIFRTAVTPGNTWGWNWKYEFRSDDGSTFYFMSTSDYGNVAGNLFTTIARGSQHAGIAGSPTAVWKWEIIVYDETGTKIVVQDVWYTESSIS